MKPTKIKIGELTLENFVGNDGQQYWRAKAANGKTFCHSEGLSNAGRSMQRFIALACHQEYRQVIEALVAECYIHDRETDYLTNESVLKRAAAVLANAGKGK